MQVFNGAERDTERGETRNSRRYHQNCKQPRDLDKALLRAHHLDHAKLENFIKLANTLEEIVIAPTVNFQPAPRKKPDVKKSSPLRGLGRPVSEDIRVEDYTDDMEIFAKGDNPPHADFDGYNTDDYLYYYDSSDPLDYPDNIDSNRKNGRGRGRGRAGGRGRSKGKEDHSAAPRLLCFDYAPLLSLCLLVNTIFTRFFLTFGAERKDTSFVS
ncbi:hypothetical protein ElyMa_000065800 [Elysia marginata]|uniref:Uncharacterized protein n=1 Tax=Elysia marginata TaxID=1093978 RepID=A0AAV4EGR9_9GAST|nr:hypothetical protein ElyMa_000065800 [Elysia marginata]